MKIREIKISNILSFKYFDEIISATNIVFDNNLNIFIGENGAGKSTALEVINFIFKKVLFIQFITNQELYKNKDSLTIADKKQILSPVNHKSFSGFRLEPNWNTESFPQKIQIRVELDDADKKNICNIIKNYEKINNLISQYTNYPISIVDTNQDVYTIEITLNKNDKTFTTKIISGETDGGYLYLANYNFYKELISFYNFENPDAKINPLHESFTLIGGYRNYHSFNPAISLQNSSATQQMDQISSQEYSRSLNANEQSEPSVFNLVRLRVANNHYEIYGEKSNGTDCEVEANNQSFLKKINEKLKLVNLEVKIKFIDKQKWSYSFQFYDLKRKKPLADINCLSAGQKAIIHLVFEAYGKGESKGGLIIIDEPEIHLHHQFQSEYLRVIEEINKEQKCQYILVTHSESLINSTTIHNVKRFALDENNNTVVKAPSLTTDQRMLVKILDNTRSNSALFGKKVILVEGEDDRYFYKAFLNEIMPFLNQEIAVLDISGKPDYQQWKDFFEIFGLSVFFIGDFDEVLTFINKTNPAQKLHDDESVKKYKIDFPNITNEIEKKYLERIYILKDGDLEHYLGIHNKGLPEIIKFCSQNLKSYIEDAANEKTLELKSIFDKITTCH